MEKILDISNVQEILLDDKEEIAELLKLFISTLLEFQEAVERCIETNDIDGFKFAMHKFKSSCQFVASSTFVETLKTLERTAIEDLSNHIPSIEHIKASLLQLKQEIEYYLDVNEEVKD